MKDAITIVSGLPRSGTSMMMKMIEAGGMAALTDNIRKPDEDNPKGYYEFERVKKTRGDSSWLDEAKGRVVKMVSMLLYDLPSDRSYKVVFMKRDFGEMLASQKKMLERKGLPAGAGDEKMVEIYRKHMTDIEKWLAERKNFDVLYVSYNDIMTEPAKQTAAVNAFLGGELDELKMTEAVDSSLYRNRK